MDAFVLPMLLLASGAPARSDTVVECTSAQAQMQTADVDWKLVRAHRRYTVPRISYPFGTHHALGWGLELELRVGADGHVICYRAYNPAAESINDRMRAALATVGSWRYEPVVLDGRPTAAADYVTIREEELPEHEQPLPSAPLEAYTVTLERTVCYGSCPAYTVVIHGDGAVEFEGKAFVAAPGKHAYRIPKADVVRLIQGARDMDIWSMRDAYSASITDMPTHRLTIQVGTQTHRIVDYAGERVGMPKSVSDFEDLVDTIGQTRQWVEKPAAH